MKIYQILLYNKATKETTKVEDFPTLSMTALKKRLLELQKDYCGVDDVPVVKEQKISDGDFLIKALVADSNCNFCYLSPIGHV